MSIAVSAKTIAAAAALAAAVSMSVGMAAPSGAATAVSIGATASQPDVPVGALHKWQYTHNFWGEDPDGVVSKTEVVNYPASIGIAPLMSMDDSVNIGANRLDATLRSLPQGEKTVVVCESQGCIAATVLLTRYAADPSNAPDLSNVVFVGAGNPSVSTGIAGKNPGMEIPLVRVTSPGEMPTTVKGYEFTREFDFFAYTPDDLGGAMLNPVVAANYLASFLTVHPNYGVVDPDNLPAGTLVKQDGQMTSYIIPTDVAPVLIPMKAGFDALGLGDQFDQINQQMLDQIRPYYEKNREGYAPISSAPSTDAPKTASQTSSESSTPAQASGGPATAHSARPKPGAAVKLTSTRAAHKPSKSSSSSGTGKAGSSRSHASSGRGK